MNRKIKFLLISMLMIGLLINENGTVALAEIQLVLPIEGYYLGGNWYFGGGPFKPYLGIAHEYSLGNTLYRYGGEYFHGTVTYDLNYGFWVNYLLPGYGFKKGLEGSITYRMDTKGGLMITAFSGNVSRSTDEVVETSYLNMYYSRQIYVDRLQDWKLLVRGLIGKENGARAGDGEYFVLNSLIMGKINNFKVIPQLGFIQAVGTVEPYFDLKNFLRGYNQGARTGAKLAVMTLDQQFPLFKDREAEVSQAPKTLMGSVFLDAGDVLPAEQDWTALQLHWVAGVGLVSHLGDLELRLDLAFTDNGKQKLILWMTM